jgi:hypothetical protein
MAEVRIEGGGELDGAILKGAATEATLQALVKVLSGGATGSSTAGTTAARLARQTPKDLNDLRKEVKNTENQFEKLQNRGRAASKAIYDFGHSLLISGNKLGDLTQSITSFMAVMGPGAAALGIALQALVNEVDRQIVRFRELSQVGADFGSGIFGSRMAAIEAGLSLDLFKDQVMANTNTFSLLGGNVMRGTRAFAAISRNIQMDFQPTLSRLGFTMEETTDYITDYLEIQTQLGKAQQMSNQELTDGSKEYLLQLDLLTRITGLSRKQASEELKRQAQDLKLKSLMATMDKTAQQNLQQIIAGLGQADPRLKSAIEEMVVTGGAPVSEFGRMLASTSPELASLAAGVRNGSVSSAEFAAGVRRAAAGAEANRGQLQGLATAAAVTGNEMYLAQASLLGLTEYQNGAAEATEAQMKAQQDATKAVANFDSQLAKFRNALIMVISPLLELVSGALSGLSEIISFIAIPFKYLGDGVRYVTTKMGDLGQAVKIILGIAMAAGIYKGAGAIGGGIKTVGGKMLGGAANLLGTGGAGSSAAAASKAGGASAVGKVAGAVGSVASAKAVGVLSLGILALGGALAGATWLMGGALEKLGTGLGKVADVDGDRLKSVGEGVKELASAMVLLSTSGGFGNTFAGTESFAKNINATLDSLDINKLGSYTEALNNLGESFTKVQSGMASAVSSSGKTSAEKLDELNMTMKEVLHVLEGSKRYQRETAAAVGEI